MQVENSLKYFYKVSNIIKIDIDDRSRLMALQIMEIFNSLGPIQDKSDDFTYQYFDNYRFGLSFSDYFTEIHVITLK